MIHLLRNRRSILLLFAVSHRHHRPSHSFSCSALVRTSRTIASSTALTMQASMGGGGGMPTPSKRYPYEPPKWTYDVLTNAPSAGRLHLANLPTPLYRLDPFPHANSRKPGILQSLRDDYGISLYVKRDDATSGPELGGNKLRKLEFLLADALDKGCDSVVTIGGEQSNHCRATACAARSVGLEPHLILRTRRADGIYRHSLEKKIAAAVETRDDKKEAAGGGEGMGYVGNVLFDRLVASSIYTCTPGEYGRVGSEALVSRLCAHLERQPSASNSSETKKPYPIPVGGSNPTGTWGYINAVDELLHQWTTTLRNDDGSVPRLDHVVFATGSGGTAAGITLGMALARPKNGRPGLHGVGVCDDPDYFYTTVADIGKGMGLVLPSYITPEQFVRENLLVYQGKGRGYAQSTRSELDFVRQFALETGIALDPVYTGKALYRFVTEVVPNDPERFRNSNVVFWHTGGALGLYERGAELVEGEEGVEEEDGGEKKEEWSPVRRLDVYGKLAGGDDRTGSEEDGSGVNENDSAVST